MTTVDGPTVVDGGQNTNPGPAGGDLPAPGTPDIPEHSGVPEAPPGPTVPAASTEPVVVPPRRSRAGRDLPAAIGVGALLGAIILVALFTVRAAFTVVVAAAVAIGTVEVIRALRLTGLRVPIVPLAVGAFVTPPMAYLSGLDGLLVAVTTTMAVAVVLRLFGPGDGLLRDLAGIVFVAGYVGFPAGFAALLTAAPEGSWRVLAFVGTVVASDIGGYAAGVLSGGRHKMAPSVSPGKSWEGFAGSALACMAVGAVVLAWPLGAHAWQGVVLGLVTACTATVGDLGESLLKRDIGIKDMGSLLPGHGGIMDRLDSLLCTAPVSWLLLTAFLH
ncbi:phosphatidate cytidylyltransferase [Frankia sp. R82]|uniref:phosphatidate cytidylyltransferase n=1 Tax=Frankia sp. R82 TaxID=2950553 RepID=UPI00204361B3|nr:phosphatidate cytidylyltransferase [Frankia sp. R82]MCM3887215.1 phosphatidate cytidylyltransferase [Frankia sp. R82]